MKHALLALGTILQAAAFGQTATPPPTFEAASLKLNTSTSNGTHSHSTPGALRISNYTLRSLLVAAYGVKESQVAGGPKWVDSDRYDIDAKAAGPAGGRELYQMLQSLLTERFKLVVHRESKAFPGYALVVTKGGLKMKPVEDDGNHSSNSDGGPITFKAISMARLADWMARRLGVPVVDATEIHGVFNFVLDWTPDNRSSAEVAPGAVPVPADPSPSLFAALQEQLGLRAEPRKISLEVIVVDHAEKPAEN